MSGRPAAVGRRLAARLDRIGFKDPRRGLVWFGSMLVGALIAMAGFVIFELRNAALRDIEARSAVLAAALAEQTALALENIDDAAVALARLATDRTLDQPVRLATLGPALGALAEESPHLYDLFLIGTDGATLAGATVPSSCREALRPDKPATVLTGGASLAPIVGAPAECFGGGPALRLTRPLADRNGKTIGTLVSALGVDFLARLYPQGRHSRGQVIAFFRDDGTLLARQPRVANAFGRSYADHPGLQSLRQTATGVIRDYRNPVDGVLSIAAAGTVRGYGANLVVSSAEAAVLRSWRRETIIIAVAVLAASAMIVLLTLLLVRQLTQRERTAAELVKAKEEAEQATRLKSRFLAVLSHELRTPLNAILGFSEILMRETFGPHTAKAYADYGKDIHASAGHLIEVINGVLEVARSEASQQELAAEEVDLGQVVAGCLGMLRDLAAAAGLTLVAPPQHSLPRILADHRAITQVLLNVLSNAIKFTPAGGSIALSCRHEAGGDLVLAISDTGTGIARKDLERLFEPFFQPQSSRKREGSGLGLSICRELMTALGGSIAVASELGHGTVVSLRLPAARVLDHALNA